MLLIYYGKHNQEVDDAIVAVRPEYLIGNTVHGLWGDIYGHGTGWLMRDLARFRRAGVKVIGYLTSGYEGRGSGGGIDLKWCSLEMNRKLIGNMAEKDGVDGVFIDECSDYPDARSKRYLVELSDLAHRCGLMVWGNVGVDSFDEWFFSEGGFDLMNAGEDWRGQPLTPVQRKWGSRISVTGFNAAYTAADADSLVKAARDRGLAGAFISDNEYNRLPGWMQEAAARPRAL
jgi:hypothetical protein